MDNLLHWEKRRALNDLTVANHLMSSARAAAKARDRECCLVIVSALEAHMSEMKQRIKEGEA